MDIRFSEEIRKLFTPTEQKILWVYEKQIDHLEAASKGMLRHFQLDVSQDG